MTGVILRAAIYLKAVESQWIERTVIKTANLQETFDAFEANKAVPYSVAWIDCLAGDKNRGRSLVMLGDFAKDGDLAYQPKAKLNIPVNLPDFVLSNLSVKIFNSLYYAKSESTISRRRVGVDDFFYPLDAIGHWNRIYGRGGFVQLQFILPKKVSLRGLESFLRATSQAKQGTFLAVLKLYGQANENLLSFPMEGYGLALDFKMQPGLPKFIKQLISEVVALGGRVYLAKDALLTQQQFAASYPNANKFRLLRQKLGLVDYFRSLQSQRLGL